MMPAATLFEPVAIKTKGAVLRTACFAHRPDVPKRGVCVLLNGQTEFIEKYFEVIDELRARGFLVVTMDWRGQGGSSRMLADLRKGYVRDFADYDDDLDTLLQDVVAPLLRPGEKPLALAHSMGGHILLRTLARQPDRFAGAVLNAPMIAVSFRGNPEILVRAITAFQMWRGKAHDWVWGMEARDPHNVNFTTQMVTSDQPRFDRTQALLRTHPDLRLAGATWGWLAAALASMDGLKPYAHDITTPALVVGASDDRICQTPAIKTFAQAMPNARYLEIAGAGHEILMEHDTIRTQFWAAFDHFIAA